MGFSSATLRSASWVLAASVTTLLACGSSDDEAASDGNGGAAGSGASGGQAGSGGMAAGGTGGAAGSAGTAGSGAHAGTAGAGGSGGGGGYGGSGGSGGVLPDGGPSDAAGDGSADATADGSGTDATPGTAHPDCDRLVALDAELSTAATETDKAVLVEQTLLEVQESGGFPVRCAPDATFFFRMPDGWSAPHVAGDFNGWEPTAAPMHHVAEDLYRVTLPVDTGQHRYLYKITDGTHWMADPMARRFGFDAYGEYSLVQGGPDQGHLERHFGIAGNGLPSRPLTIYLPPGYETSGQDYPVLYAHDGQNLFDPEASWGGWRLDQSIETLIADGTIQPLVVVGIHNTTARMDEYTHVQDEISGQSVGGMAEAYYGLVRTRVMPLVEGLYRVRTGPSNTWTMGSSLGGLVSLYFGLQHDDVFGRVAGLSSTLGWGSIGAQNPTLMDLLAGLGKPSVVVYLDSGGSDGGGCTDSDSDGVMDDTPGAADNYCETVQMRDALQSAGFEQDVDLFHWHEPGAEHNEAAWAARMALPLEVLAAP